MSKLKIAHVLHCVGGVDIYLRLITNNISQDKFETIVIHGKKDLIKPLSNQVIEYTVPIIRNISVFNDINAIYQTYNILKREKPNLIHCHSAKGGVIGRIVGALLNIKVIYTPHAFSYLSAENKIKKVFFLLLEKVFSRGNSYILGTSKSEMKRSIVDVGYNTKKAFYINNAISPLQEKYNLMIEKKWPDEYICTVGRPSYQKNIELMVLVLSKVAKTHNIHLVIMGVGHHSDRLFAVKKLINALNLNKNVTLIEWTDRENILHIIQNSKFYISTSRYEGMPYSVIESMCLGKPCVVSNCDGNKDVVIDGYNGYLINDENIEKYKEKIINLLEDIELLNILSKNAKKSFETNHNLNNLIKDIENFYNKIYFT